MAISSWFKAKAGRSELIIPESTKGDPNAIEVLRVWIAHKSQHVSIRADAWEDAGAWGIMLADLARHVANAYEQQKGLDRATTLLRIKALLDAELASPTDAPTGHIVS